jgi:hypothetical protein
MTKKKENNEILRANKINHSNNRDNMKEGKEKNRIEGKITKGSPDYII